MQLPALFPHLTDAIVDGVALTNEGVAIDLRLAAATATCPDCGQPSGRVHGRYRRRLADLPAAGRGVVLRLVVRRFRCATPACRRRTFAEQAPALAAPRRRRSAPLLALLAALGLALGGRPGARLARRLAMPASRTTLLRLVRALPDPAAATPRVLGVDEFALRRGRAYATLLIDLETRRPVDLLPGQTAAAFSAWLVAHPGVEVVVRDRHSAYADGAAQGAPAALQVADRWHLVRNAADAVERAVERLRGAADEPAAPTAEATEPAPSAQALDGALDASPAAPPLPRRAGRLAARTRQRHALVHALLARGVSLSDVARALSIDRKTARRYARAAAPDDLLPPARRRRTLLDPFKPYLDRRWAAGCRNAARLTREIARQGYRGSSATVRVYLRERRTGAPPTADPAAPTSRRLAWLLLRRPDDLRDDERALLDDACHGRPALAEVGRLGRAFLALVRERRGEALGGWVEAAEASGVRELKAFAIGLKRDWEAVVAGMTLGWSAGPTEGHVNRVKALKRQMFGRAGVDLLRKRVLLAS
jgi:transposase